jgi:hypothetical protein
MSNVQTNEALAEKASPEERLLATHHRLLITAAFCCVGWPLFLGGMKLSDGGGGILITLLGAIIAAGPILYRIAKNRGIKAAFRIIDEDQYEVVTTYSNGSKTSDGGSQSFWINIVLKILMAGLLLFAGCIVTLVYLIYLIIRYVILYLMINPKPSFLQSAFPIIAGGFLVLIGAPVMIGLIINTKHAIAAASDYRPAEIRSIIEETKKQLFANPFRYSVQKGYDWNRGHIDQIDADRAKANITVMYDNAGNTTVIEITSNQIASYNEQYRKGTTNLLPGRFTFNGNNFSGYVDLPAHTWWYGEEESLTPNDADIEAVKYFLPANFFFGRLRNISNNALWAKNYSDNRIDIKMHEEGSIVSLYVKRNGDTYILERANIRGLVPAIFYN